MYLSVRDVSKKLSKSEETIKRWLRTGKFPNAIKVSDKEGWKIPISDVEGQVSSSSESKQISLELNQQKLQTDNNEKELISLAYQAVTLSHPTEEILNTLMLVGIKRTLEILLVMQQSSSKVKNPLGFVKRAIKENWTPTTLPQRVNRRIHNFNERHGFNSTSNHPPFPMYNWLDSDE